VSQQTTLGKRTAVDYLARARRRLAVETATALCRKPIAIKPNLPLISFTFDDFPRTAFLEAGRILGRYNILGTYYVSFSLMGKQSQLGPMFHLEDLKELLRQGHELGCHTFGHCHSWDTPPHFYERAIIENQEALREMVPGARFQTFAYPHSWPHLGVKKVASAHFRCCRGGGRKPINIGTADLNLLSATFLEQTRDNPRAVKALIDDNARARGWLIFATHDLSGDPSPFGCTPDFFEQVVQWSVESGARILPVVGALKVLQGSLSF